MRVLYSFPHMLGKPGISTTAYHQIQGLIEQGVDGRRRLYEPPARRSRRQTRDRDAEARRTARATSRARRAARVRDITTGERPERSSDFAERSTSSTTWPAGCLRTLAVGAAPRRPGVSRGSKRAYADGVRGRRTRRLQQSASSFRRITTTGTTPASSIASCASSPQPTTCSCRQAYVERTFLERGHSPEQLIRHRYGFDPSSFGACRRRRTRPNGDGLTAIFVGRGEPNKGLHHALQGLGRVRCRPSGDACSSAATCCLRIGSASQRCSPIRACTSWGSSPTSAGSCATPTCFSCPASRRAARS